MVSMDSMTSAPAHSIRVAVVIPVLRDSDALRQLLADLRSQSRRPESIIVVSGGRDEQIAQIAHQEQLRLIETSASRGLQLDTGAREADAEILWFIHADARLPSDACDAIVTTVRAGASGGCLRFALQGRSSAFRLLLAWLVRVRIACGGMAYGDQALFCTRDAYLASGGFPHAPLFEEVPLIRYLRSTRRFAALATPVFVATRRWERDGWLRRSLHNRWLALRHLLGAPAEALAGAYARTHSKMTEPHG
jgi:rSAM/selenodomain-associated transferase 2